MLQKCLFYLKEHDKKYRIRSIGHFAFSNRENGKILQCGNNTGRIDFASAEYAKDLDLFEIINNYNRRLIKGKELQNDAI